MKTADEIINHYYDTCDSCCECGQTHYPVEEMMEEYAELARKDERVKVLEEMKDEFYYTNNADAYSHVNFKLTQLKETK